MKRTERHHLKEDGMVRGMSLAAEFLKKYQKELMMAGGALVLAALVFAALTLIRSHNQAVRSRVIGEINEIVARLDEKPEEGLAELEKLADQGRSARLANLELAKYWFGKGDFAKAESFLARVPSGRKDLLHYQIEDLKAQISIRQGDHDEAIAVYSRMRDERPKAYPLDAILFHLASAHELKGERQEALEIYKKLQQEFTQTYYGYEASQKASRLELAR